MFPTLFLSHSTPLLALDDSPLIPDYQHLAKQLPFPQAILIMSAHWETEQLSLGEICTHQKLIYDFYGFPDRLYHQTYLAPAADWLVAMLNQLLNTELPIIERGLDHGVWVPLYRMYPKADVPILQISLPKNLDNAALYQLGKQLSPLREQGVLIIGSGMLTHNLAALRYADRSVARTDAITFDNWIETALLNADEQALINWHQAPCALANHPTAEHFKPLLFAAGAGGLTQVAFAMQGFEFEAFSRRSVVFAG